MAALCAHVARTRRRVLAERAQVKDGHTILTGGRTPLNRRRKGRKGLKAKIYVTLKKGILDPQGKAVEHALNTLGFQSATNVRMGKYVELEINESARGKAEADLKIMCEKLLANTVIEDYRYEIEG